MRQTHAQTERRAGETDTCTDRQAGVQVRQTGVQPCATAADRPGACGGLVPDPGAGRRGVPAPRAGRHSHVAPAEEQPAQSTVRVHLQH